MRQISHPVLFGGHKMRNNLDLKGLSSGDTMILVRQKLNDDGTPASVEAERVTILGVESHMGNTVNGIKVERAHDKVITHDDFVDLVSFKLADGSQKQMLYGSYEQDDGTHSLTKGKKVVHIQNQTGGVYDERAVTQKKALVTQFKTVESFIEESLKKQVALGEEIKELKFKLTSLLDIYNGNPGAVAKKMVDFLWQQEQAKEAEVKKAAEEAAKAKLADAALSKTALDKTVVETPPKN